MVKYHTQEERKEKEKNPTQILSCVLESLNSAEPLCRPFEVVAKFIA